MLGSTLSTRNMTYVIVWRILALTSYNFCNSTQITELETKIFVILNCSLDETNYDLDHLAKTCVWSWKCMQHDQSCAVSMQTHPLGMWSGYLWTIQLRQWDQKRWISLVGSNWHEPTLNLARVLFLLQGRTTLPKPHKRATNRTRKIWMLTTPTEG